MKIIFLDIDGVLNSEKWFHIRHEKGEKFFDQENGEFKFWCSHFDSEAVSLLNKIVEETNAKIVISSSWRRSEWLKPCCDHHGISFIDITTTKDMACRGDEIQKWIDEHSKVENFVILDDDRDMLDSQMENFVLINRDEGLTEETAQKAIKILKNC